MLQFHSDFNTSICSHFLGVGLVPEQRQKVSPVFFLTTQSHRGGWEWRQDQTQHEPHVDSTCATTCMFPKGTGEPDEALLSKRNGTGAQPASHRTAACPCLSLGDLIQAIGDECWEEHVCELEVRCGTEYSWAHFAQDGNGSHAVLNCIQQTVTSKNYPFANWFGIRRDTQALIETVVDARLPGLYPTVCGPLSPCPCINLVYGHNSSKSVQNEQVIFHKLLNVL